MLNIRDWRVVGFGCAISVGIPVSRLIGSRVIRDPNPQNRRFVSAIYARGLAPAVLVQIGIEKGIIQDTLSQDIVYFVITATILLSSVQIFLCKRKMDFKQTKV